MPTGNPPRHLYLGSSDIAAILGVSKWASAYDVWDRKMHPGETEDDKAKARIFRRGKLLEPYVIDMLAGEHDLFITGRNTRHVHPIFPFLQCEVDAESEDFDGENIDNVEIKTVSPFAVADWGEPGTDEIPTYYMAQVQFALMVTRRKRTIVAALIGADELRVYYVNRDEEIISHILAEAVTFWTNHVETETPPPVKTGEDADKWLKRFNGVTLEATPDTTMMCRELLDLKREAKEYDQRIEIVQDALKVALAAGIPNLTATPTDCAIVDVNGKVLLTWNQQTSKRLDVEEVKKALGTDLPKFEKPSTFRVLRLKEKNL